MHVHKPCEYSIEMLRFVDNRAYIALPHIKCDVNKPFFCFFHKSQTVVSEKYKKLSRMLSKVPNNVRSDVSQTQLMIQHVCRITICVLHIGNLFWVLSRIVVKFVS